MTGNRSQQVFDREQIDIVCSFAYPVYKNIIVFVKNCNHQRTAPCNMEAMHPMKRVISLMLVCILLLGGGCSNPEQVKPVSGKYYLDKEGSTSFIEVLENNTLLFSDVRFADLEKDFYESIAIALFNQENDKSGILLSEQERAAKTGRSVTKLTWTSSFPGKRMCLIL